MEDFTSGLYKIEAKMKKGSTIRFRCQLKVA